jgi:class 3 adenylate cyclase
VTFGEQLNENVARFLGGDYETFKPQGVPTPEKLPMAESKAARFEAAMLFVDIRQSSAITESFRLQTAAKMIRAYCDGSVRIIHFNQGSVRSFNGDGMLAVFIGDRKANNAVKAAMNLAWFAQEVLRPKFQRYFRRNSAARAVAGGFRIGCGVDVGELFAVRVGIGGTNDIAWVGRPTNAAAKLAAIARPPRSILITREVYSKLAAPQLLQIITGVPMWTPEQPMLIAGGRRFIRRTSFLRRIK